MEECHGRCCVSLDVSECVPYKGRLNGRNPNYPIQGHLLARPAATMKVLGFIFYGIFLAATEASAAQLLPEQYSDSTWSSAFIGTLLMIVCSELGDKTFLITAVLSMRCKNNGTVKAGFKDHSSGRRWHVFAGGFLALAVMTLIAAAGGRVLPFLLNQQVRMLFMVSLLVVFGIKMLHEAAAYEEGSEEPGLVLVDTGTLMKVPKELKELSAAGNDSTNKLIRIGRSVFSPVFIQTATLVLMAEWGDRSQFATFALAADRSASAVCLGAILGHGLCTALAVIGGNVLAKRISERLVLLLGGICFLSFAALTVGSELYSPGGAFN